MDVWGWKMIIGWWIDVKKAIKRSFHSWTQVCKPSKCLEQEKPWGKPTKSREQSPLRSDYGVTHKPQSPPQPGHAHWFVGSHLFAPLLLPRSCWTVVLPTIHLRPKFVGLFAILFGLQQPKIFILLMCFGIARSELATDLQTSKAKRNSQNSSKNHKIKQINPPKWFQNTWIVHVNATFITLACVNLCLSLSRDKLKQINKGRYI